VNREPVLPLIREIATNLHENWVKYDKLVNYLFHHLLKHELKAGYPQFSDLEHCGCNPLHFKLCSFDSDALSLALSSWQQEAFRVSNNGAGWKLRQTSCGSEKWGCYGKAVLVAKWVRSRGGQTDKTISFSTSKFWRFLFSISGITYCSSVQNSNVIVMYSWNYWRYCRCSVW
jgi:hypothetical protein